MTKRTEIHQDEQVELYEIGYLVVPTVAIEQLPGVVQEIKSILEKHKAIINQEGALALRDLAYEIKKSNRAYFGWITFKVSTEETQLIKKEIDALGSILRYLLMKVDEPVIIAPRFTPGEESNATVSETKVSDEDLDKKIEHLVTA